jgi:Leucine-rich repeat (LRR) protein
MSLLSDLNLSYNIFDTIVTTCLPQGIKRLDLSFNNFRQRLDALQRLQDLEILQIPGNHVAVLPDLRQLRHLLSIDASWNSLTSLPVLPSSVSTLSFSHNSVSFVVDLSGLSNLQTVDLSWNRLDACPAFDAAAPLEVVSGLKGSERVSDHGRI